MFSFFRKKQNLHRSDDVPNADICLIDVISVPRIDRWRVYYRLQELKIPCWCLPDGSLQVEVQTSLGALLLRSVVQQFVAPRQEMVNWLERCWETELY